MPKIFFFFKDSYSITVHYNFFTLFFLYIVYFTSLLKQ